jgi:hypothetical protein
MSDVVGDYKKLTRDSVALERARCSSPRNAGTPVLLEDADRPQDAQDSRFHEPTARALASRPEVRRSSIQNRPARVTIE